MDSNRSRNRGSKKKKLTASVACVCVALAAVVCAFVVPTAASAKSATTYLIGSGSSAAQPYMEALFTKYTKLHPTIKFKYTADGGNAGVKDVQSGASEFAIQTAPPVQSNSGTTFYKLFRDALCIDVNSSNKLTALKVGKVADIFEGDDTTWGQVSGSTGLGSTTILPEGRTSSAGQYTFFVSAVLKGGKESGSVSQLTSDGLVKTAIQNHKGAIGYVGLANAHAKKERALKINGYACDRATVKSEKYPLYRYDWAVLPKTDQNPKVVAFFNWVIHSAAAGKVINNAGAVAVFNN